MRAISIIEDIQSVEVDGIPKIQKSTFEYIYDSAKMIVVRYAFRCFQDGAD